MTGMPRNGMSAAQLSFIAGAWIEVIANHYAHLMKDDAYEAMMRVVAGSNGPLRLRSRVARGFSERASDRRASRAASGPVGGRGV
jgi:hypothetical protein